MDLAVLFWLEKRVTRQGLITQQPHSYPLPMNTPKVVYVLRGRQAMLITRLENHTYTCPQQQPCW